MKVSPSEAEGLVTALLEAAGAPSPHARLQAETLVDAELRGHPSHGLQRLPRLLDRIERGLADPHARGEMVWTKPSELLVDGQNGLGPVTAFAALDALLDRVDETGIAFAAIRNSNHLGMLAFYVEAMARAGKICLAFSTSEALVHPFGGTRAMLGTNPVAIGIPTGDEPFILDLATSLVSMGKIHDHALRGAPLPQGWALDESGTPTTDAHRAKSGSIASFGGAKGFGLGLAVELLVASLAGSAFAPDVRGTLDAEHLANKGDLFILINPAGTHGRMQASSDYLACLRASTPADPAHAVSIPGDGARARRNAALRNGFDVTDTLWSALQARRGHPIQTQFSSQDFQS